MPTLFHFELNYPNSFSFQMMLAELIFYWIIWVMDVV